MNKSLRKILAKNQLRATRSRGEVFDVLQKSPEPLKMITLVKHCANVDKTSVYRAIQLFQKLDLVTTTSDGWRNYYELAAEFRPHHHHLICMSCGRVVDINSPALEKLVLSIAKANDFAATSHSFEIFGLCPECQKSREK